MSFAQLILEAKTDGLKRAEGDLNSLRSTGARTEKGVSGSMGKMSKGFNVASLAAGKLAVAATAAIASVAGIGQAIGVIRQFETSMSQVAAITGATAGELEALRDVAKDLGSTTEFSASQAADGLKFLGMAGFDAAESIKAIPAVLDLATASAMGLAQAADISSNVLSGFGLAAGDAAQVADVLAAASSRSNTSVAQLGGAMSTVAPIAAALDISLQDTAAAIGVMSDAGIQGERAGTALRGVLASLAGPTDAAADALSRYGLNVADVDPATRSLTEIFGTLQERGLSTADAMEIFGREAASGALVLAGASRRVGEFGNELRDAEGAASDMAGIMRDNLAGSANSALSAMQGLAVAIGEAGLTAILRGALISVTAIVRGITEVVQVIGDLTGRIADMDMFKTATMQLAAASDTANLAIADEIAQVNALTTATGDAVVVSEIAALNKLREAEAHLASAEAKQKEAQATLINSDAYQSVIANIDGAREALRAMRTEGDDLDQMPLKMRDAYEELEQSLVDAYSRQKELLALIPETSEGYEAAQAAVDDLKRRIGEAKDGTVVLAGATAEAADITAALARLADGIDFGNAIAGAVQLAKTLNISVVAAASLQNLQASIDSGGGRGQDPRLFMDGGRLAGNASNAAAAMRRIQEEIDRVAASASKGSKATGGLSKSMKDAEKAADALNKEIERLEFEADPVAKYNAELERLEELAAAGLSDGAYSAELEKMNEELANSIPMVNDVANAFGDFIASGLSDFKGFAQSILRSFTNMLSQMIAAAARNRILFSMGITGGGVAGAAQAATGGGLLGGLLGVGGGGIAGLAGTGGIMGGIGSLASGLGGILSGGGLGASFANLGGLVSGSVGGLGAIGAAIPAIGLVVAGLSLFIGKTKELDNGLRLTVDNMDTLVETFSKVEKSRLFGLIKSRKTYAGEADPETADPIIAAVAEIQSATRQAAGALGFGADAFKDFSATVDISLKGLSEQESLQAVQEGLDKVTSAMAETLPGLSDFAQGGETAGETLTRLSSSLMSVNDTFAALNYQLFEASLSGADMASSLVQLMGGMQGFTDATSFFVSNFYTDAEQLQIAANALHAEFARLNITTPSTAAQFRQLVEAQNLTTQSGQQTYAQLMKIAPAFMNVANAAASAANTANAAAGSAVAAANSLQVPIPEAGSVADAAMAEAKRMQALARRQMRSASRSASRSSGVSSAQRERERLEVELLRLQGNTAELRRRELAALKPANRALQEMIWGLEDAKKAMDGFSPKNFATAVDMQRARALAANSNSAMIAAIPSAPSADVEAKKEREERKEEERWKKREKQHEIELAHLREMNKHLRRLVRSNEEIEFQGVAS